MRHENQGDVIAGKRAKWGIIIGDWTISVHQNGQKWVAFASRATAHGVQVHLQETGHTPGAAIDAVWTQTMEQWP